MAFNPYLKKDGSFNAKAVETKTPTQRPQTAYNGGQRGGYSNNQPYSRPAPVQPSTAPKEIPDDYADAAEKAICTIGASSITSSKLRNIFSLFSDVYNDIRITGSDTLTPEQITMLTGARVRLVYECGREDSVKRFVQTTEIIPYLMSIKNDAQKLLKFYHYIEALVAYHRFYGGK